LFYALINIFSPKYFKSPLLKPINIASAGNKIIDNNLLEEETTRNFETKSSTTKNEQFFTADDTSAISDDLSDSFRQLRVENNQITVINLLVLLFLSKIDSTRWFCVSCVAFFWFVTNLIRVLFNFKFQDNRKRICRDCHIWSESIESISIDTIAWAIDRLRETGQVVQLAS